MDQVDYQGDNQLKDQQDQGDYQEEDQKDQGDFKKRIRETVKRSKMYQGDY